MDHGVDLGVRVGRRYISCGHYAPLSQDAHLEGVPLFFTPHPPHPIPLSLSGQAAAAREAEQLRAMLAAAERAAERETRRGRAEVDSRRQRSAPGAVQPSSPAQERERAARLLGRVTTAERLVASPEERDLDSISIPSSQRSAAAHGRRRCTSRCVRQNREVEKSGRKVFIKAVEHTSNQSTPGPAQWTSRGYLPFSIPNLESTDRRLAPKPCACGP